MPIRGIPRGCNFPVELLHSLLLTISHVPIPLPPSCRIDRTDRRIHESRGLVYQELSYHDLAVEDFTAAIELVSDLLVLLEQMIAHAPRVIDCGHSCGIFFCVENVFVDYFLSAGIHSCMCWPFFTFLSISPALSWRW